MPLFYITVFVINLIKFKMAAFYPMASTFVHTPCSMKICTFISFIIKMIVQHWYQSNTFCTYWIRISITFHSTHLPSKISNKFINLIYCRYIYRDMLSDLKHVVIRLCVKFLVLWNFKLTDMASLCQTSFYFFTCHDTI